MVDIEILQEKPIMLADVKECIEDVKKKKDLNFRESKCIDYINTFTKIKAKDAEKLKKGIEELNIGRLKDRHIIKIIDLMTDDIESLKLILSGEDITLKQEDLNKLIEVVKKYA